MGMRATATDHQELGSELGKRAQDQLRAQVLGQGAQPLDPIARAVAEQDAGAPVANPEEVGAIREVEEHVAASGAGVPVRVAKGFATSEADQLRLAVAEPPLLTDDLEIELDPQALRLRPEPAGEIIRACRRPARTDRKAPEACERQFKRIQCRIAGCLSRAGWRLRPSLEQSYPDGHARRYVVEANSQRRSVVDSVGLPRPSHLRKTVDAQHVASLSPASAIPQETLRFELFDPN